MPNIAGSIQNLCDTGATALLRYAEVSGQPPYEAPEYFMPAFIFDRLGQKNNTATLETRFSTLSEWNDDARKLIGLSPRSFEEEAQLMKIGQEIGQQRVDMVLFSNDENSKSKDRLPFLALIEFKKGLISADDHIKLLRILPYIDTCDYGVVCGCIDAANLERYKNQSETAFGTWFQSAAINPPIAEGNAYFVCARLFKNPAKR
jgi:hypothetical protein